MKKVIGIILSVSLIGIILFTSLVTMIITVLGNNSNIGVFNDYGNIDMFDITGTQNGNNYNLKFKSKSWEISDIKLNLKDKKGIATAIVPLTMNGGNAAQAAVEWAKARAEESKAGKWYYIFYGSSGNGKNGLPRSTKCPLCHPRSGPVGWQCIGFVTAAYFHGAGVPSDIHESVTECYLGGLGDGGDGTTNGSLSDPSCNPEKIYKKWVKRNGDSWIMAAHTGSTKSGHLTADQLEPGDVLLCYKSNGGCYHMAMYIGDDQYVDCSRSHGKKGGIRVNTYGNRSTVRIAMRYTGGNNGTASATDTSQFSSDKVLIGEAMKGEKGLTGNKAGDGNGKEVQVHDFDGSWSYVLHPKNESLRADIADAMKKACANDYIGYDYSDRGTCYEQAGKAKWDMSAINKKCETSCIDLVSCCLRSAGISEKYAKKFSTTAGFWGQIRGCGVFSKKAVSESELSPGDILVKISTEENEANGRAAIVVGSPNLISGAIAGGVSSGGGGGGGTKLGGISHSSQDVINGACAWAEAIAADDSFHYGSCNKDHSHTKPKVNNEHTMCAHHNGCYFCGTNTNSDFKWIVNKDKTYCCNPLVHAAFAHGGGEPTMLKICKRGSSYGFGTGRGTYHTSKLFKNLGKPPFSSLQKGDVLCYGKHVALYLGNNRLVEATGKDDNVEGSKGWKDSIQVRKITSYGKFTRAYRYIGNGGGAMELPEGAAGGGFNFSKKPKGTIIGEITASTGKRKRLANGSTYDVAQSFAYVNGGYAVAFQKREAVGTGEVRFYDENGNYKSHKTATLNHANGSCATPDGALLVAGQLCSSTNKANKFTFKGNSMTHKGQVGLGWPTSSIAYDRDTGMYILSRGKSMWVSKDRKTSTKTLDRNAHGTYCQDIGAGGGFIFAAHCTDKKKGENYVDIYDENTGDFCGSYHVTGGELESVDIVNGEIVLLVHIKSTEKNYIQFTGISGGTDNNVELTILYVKKKDGSVTFRGTLAGGSIVGQFTTKRGDCFGNGVFGGTLGVGGGMENIGNTGNPFGNTKFYITDIACAFVPGHTNSFHDGWDLAVGEAHAPIYAVGGGKVVNAGPYGGYGNHVVIIQNGNNYTLYGHMSAMTVKVGDTVSAGQRIGNQGNEGHSFGNHLHLEFRKGKNSNTASTANLSGIQSMLQQYAVNYNSYTGKFKNIKR